MLKINHFLQSLCYFPNFKISGEWEAEGSQLEGEAAWHFAFNTLNSFLKNFDWIKVSSLEIFGKEILNPSNSEIHKILSDIKTKTDFRGLNIKFEVLVQDKSDRLISIPSMGDFLITTEEESNSYWSLTLFDDLFEKELKYYKEPIKPGANHEVIPNSLYSYNKEKLSHSLKTLEKESNCSIINWTTELYREVSKYGF